MNSFNELSTFFKSFQILTSKKCINQLLSINYDVLSAIEMALKVHMKLLDISKAYDKVWYNGLTFTLCQNGICVEVINFLLEFHRDRVFQIANGCFELIFKLVYHKVKFWNSFCFLYTSAIYQIG